MHIDDDSGTLEVTSDQELEAFLARRDEMDGVPVTLNVYLMQKDGCVYDLTHVAARAEAERARPAFEAFGRGFAVLASHAPQAKK